jgi:hypothetical protein
MAIADYKIPDSTGEWICVTGHEVFYVNARLNTGEIGVIATKKPLWPVSKKGKQSNFKSHK